MSLPGFNTNGDLPPGIHFATLLEVVERFGQTSEQRKEVSTSLRRVVDLAIATSRLDRIVVFGSYVSDEPHPNDVDVILLMMDNFRLEECPAESRILFDHMKAEDELGASVFWARPAMLLGEPVDSFLARWQIKRDGERRGIVEVQT